MVLTITARKPQKRHGDWGTGTPGDRFLNAPMPNARLYMSRFWLEAFYEKSGILLQNLTFKPQRGDKETGRPGDRGNKIDMETWRHGDMEEALPRSPMPQCPMPNARRLYMSRFLLEAFYEKSGILLQNLILPFYSKVHLYPLLITAQG